PPAHLARAIAAEQALELVQRRDQLAGLHVVGAQPDRGVQECRLLRPDGRGPIQRCRADLAELCEPLACSHERRAHVADVAAEADRDHAGAAITGLRRMPMPSISTSTTSPGVRLPTPSGVPVEITSPTSSVMYRLQNATSVATSKIMLAVFESWRT